jgi:hypothetical protein
LSFAGLTRQKDQKGGQLSDRAKRAQDLGGRLVGETKSMNDKKAASNKYLNDGLIIPIVFKKAKFSKNNVFGKTSLFGKTTLMKKQSVTRQRQSRKIQDRQGRFRQCLWPSPKVALAQKEVQSS